MNQEPETDIVAQTRFLNLVKRRSWVFVQRPKQIGVVAIAAITDDRKMILITQYRPPTNSIVIELPAGLAGDIAGQEDESLQTAAQRELLEETGYCAANWKQLATVASSAGMTDERVTMFLATSLVKTGAGGGDESEDITVHEVPLDEIQSWIDEKVKTGANVSARVYAALHFVRANQC